MTWKMETIHLIQKPLNGQLIIAVPEGLQDREFRVTAEAIDETELPRPSRLEIAEQFAAGLSRKKNDFNPDDFNVYEQ